MTDEPKDGELTQEELDEKRHQEIVKRLDNVDTRLGKVDSSLKHHRDETSAELGNVVVRQRYHTILLKWLRDAWVRFQILPPPPRDVPDDANDPDRVHKIITPPLPPNKSE